MNDPTCRAADRPGHLCTDKNGDLWVRPGAGPRPGTTCFWEAIHRAHDGDPDRRPNFDKLRRLLNDADDREERWMRGEYDTPTGYPAPQSWDEASDLHREVTAP